MSLSRQSETEFHLGQPGSCNNHLSKYGRGCQSYFWQHKKRSGNVKKRDNETSSRLFSFKVYVERSLSATKN